MITFRNSLLELASVQVPSGAFPKHTHDEFVISANMSGHESVWIDGRSFEVGLDAVTTYNPGQIQASRTISAGTWTCTSLYVCPSAFETYFELPFEFNQSYVSRPDLARQLRLLGTSLPSSELEEGCVLLLWSLSSDSPCEERLPGKSNVAPWIRRVKDFLLSDLARVPDLRSLASLEGVSASHLVRSFHKEVGLPPLAWHMQRRIAHARELLRVGVPIVQVALETGFADQAHFTKAFVRFTGITPARFRHINF